MVLNHEEDKYEKEAEKRTLNMIREELQDDFKADNEDPDDEFSKEFKSDKNKDFFDEKESRQ